MAFNTDGAKSLATEKLTKAFKDNHVDKKYTKVRASSKSRITKREVLKEEEPVSIQDEIRVDALTENEKNNAPVKSSI
jgi:hypothetical protein